MSCWVKYSMRRRVLGLPERFFSAMTDQPSVAV
jgi:hypothetical protein